MNMDTFKIHPVSFKMNRFRIYILSMLFTLATHFSCYAEDVVKSEHFEVYYTGFKENYAAKALQNADESYLRISKALGHTLIEPITIILTNSEEQFKQLTQSAIPEWGAAAAMPDNRIIVTSLPGLKYNLNRIIAHEIVHIVINDAAQEQFVPRWFHEGCAQNLSGEWGIRGRLYIVLKAYRGELLTFDYIQNMFSSERMDVLLSYDQSMLAIRHLISKNGDYVLSLIINYMKQGNEFALAFYEATGLWPSEFEKDYQKYIRTTYGKKSLYTLIPGTWTLILFIAVVAYFVKRRRNKRLMKQWEIVEAAEKIINFEDYNRDD